MHVRDARPSDEAAVASFTRETWAERSLTDYLPEVFGEWVDRDGPTQRTLVVDVREDPEPPAEPGDVAAIAQVRLLSAWEAWASGMRVHPGFRGQGLSRRLIEVGFEWAAEQGAVVCRNMTFSWNGPALAASRSVGFEPSTELRWVHPVPDADVAPDSVGVSPADADPVDADADPVDADADPVDADADPVDADADPDGAWAFWSDSAAREALSGLVMDDGESWALSTLTRERLHDAADEGRLLTVDGGRGGFAERIRTFERTEEAGDEDDETLDGSDDRETTYAEYAIGAWSPGDADGAEAVLSAVARDAARVDADRTRVMIPEGTSWVSDAALSGASIGDEPAFVLSARLSSERAEDPTRGSNSSGS